MVTSVGEEGNNHLLLKPQMTKEIRVSFRILIYSHILLSSEFPAHAEHLGCFG